MNQQKQNHWNDVADWYDGVVGQEGSDFHQKVIFPALLRLLKKDKISFKEKSILDIGCGQGVFCRRLATLGSQVVGIDSAEELIAIAKKRTGDTKNCHYFVADASRLITDDAKLISSLQANSFDAITIILAIQNMAHLVPLFQAVKQLLKPEGSLYIVMMHPSFRVPQKSAWQWNEKERRQERVLWSYLSSDAIEITTHPGKAVSNKTIHFHRPLQTYINMLGNQGLLTEHVEELVSHRKEQAGIKSQALDYAREEFPMFLLLQARKV